MAGHTFSGNTAGDFARVQYGDIHGNVTNNEIVYNTIYLHQQRSLEIQEEERIGATACVLGLQTMAAMLIQRLDQCLSGPSASLDIITRLHTEVASSTKLLDELHHHLEGSDLSFGRTTLISASCLITSFTNAVKLFDELYSALAPISRLLDSAEPRNHNECGAGNLDELYEKLCWQITYWKMQSQILECTANIQAHETSVALNNHVSSRLAIDHALATRVQSLEQDILRLSLRMESPDPPSANTPGLESGQAEALIPLFVGDSREFELVLQQSWVYQRNQHNCERLSIRSEWTRGSDWSELSNLSMAQISVMSVIALPILVSELVHGDVYRDSGALLMFNDSGSARLHKSNQELLQHAPMTSVSACHDRLDCKLPDRSFNDEELAQALICMFQQCRSALDDTGYDAYDELSGICRMLSTCLPMSRNNFERRLAVTRLLEESEVAGIQQMIKRCDDLLTRLRTMRSWAGAAREVDFEGPQMIVVMEQWRQFVQQVSEVYFPVQLLVSTKQDNGNWFAAFLNSSAALSVAMTSSDPPNYWSTQLRYVRAALDLCQPSVHLRGKNWTHVPEALLHIMREKTCQLSLSNTSIASLTPGFARLRCLRSLSITSARLEHFPDVLFDLTDLEVLRLDSNVIALLPTEINTMKSLTTLSIARNRLVSLPATLTNMKQLQELDIDDNPFSDDMDISRILTSPVKPLRLKGTFEERAQLVCRLVLASLQARSAPEVTESLQKAVSVLDENAAAARATELEQEVVYDEAWPFSNMSDTFADEEEDMFTDDEETML